MSRTFRYTPILAASALILMLGCQSSSKMGQEVTIPSGTKVTVALEEPLRTDTHDSGDQFVARTTEPIIINGVTALPAGATVTGKLTRVETPEENNGAPEMAMKFEKVVDATGTDKSIATDEIAVVGDPSKEGWQPKEVIDPAVEQGAPMAQRPESVPEDAVPVATRDGQVDLEPGQKIAVELKRDVEVVVAMLEEPMREQPANEPRR
jgi:hypothetical protein